ncbi:capsular biosynthesis protein [Agarivorans sp. DSG3-1]|uniref:capsular biosynthesis protein n=1 Tax=Agarivorans sp. DSG3-1 TaxID=3342249 RepID=UPI00398F5B88
MKTDVSWLQANNVSIIYTPEGISLGASLVAALNLSEHNLDTSLHILFGDTLLSELPLGENIVCVSDVKESYDWAIVTTDESHWLKTSEQEIKSDAHNVVNGYFNFSKPRQLIRAMTQCNWQFLEGLNNYRDQVGLTTIYSEHWLDFGHVNSYYRSKANFTTQRAFNELIITSEWVEKASSNNKKISAEANWFNKLPFSLRGFIPQYLGSQQKHGRISYRLEYLHLTALNELYVFGDLALSNWEQILSGCVNFLKSCQQEKAPSTVSVNLLPELLEQKTYHRLEKYCISKSISLTDKWQYNNEKPISIEAMLNDCAKHLPNITSRDGLTILHGDFCFSNVLYDFRANKIKTIDPRGMTSAGEPTLFGDIRYDIAKLSHSVIGMYDWLIAGYYEVETTNFNIHFHIEESPQLKEIQQFFINLVEREFSISAVSLLAMQVHLFFSMLPLHNDDNVRQQALFANAIRLYFTMKRFEE